MKTHWGGTLRFPWCHMIKASTWLDKRWDGLCTKRARRNCWPVQLCTQLDRRTKLAIFHGTPLERDQTWCNKMYANLVICCQEFNIKKKNKIKNKARLPRNTGEHLIDQLRVSITTKVRTWGRQRYTLKRQRRVFFDVRLGNWPQA